jgi:DNA replication and repair protein RecF
VLLCQIDASYCRALARYGKVLANRNHLLRQLRGRSGVDELDYWDETLAESGGVVLARRVGVVADIARTVIGIHQELSGSDAVLNVGYLGTVVGDTALGDAVSWSAALRANLVEARRQEVARGMTLAGPHRDDLSFTIDGVDLRSFGSRGQQRTAALALKLAEAELLRSPGGDLPVVLLDDVMSELDAGRRAYLAARLAECGQVLVTATDLEHVPESFRDGAHVVGVRDATLVPYVASPPSRALRGAA